MLKTIGAGALLGSGIASFSTKVAASVQNSSNSNLVSNLLRPRPVRLGSTIGLVATATAVERDKISWAEENLLRLGFKVKTGRNAGNKYGYLAGTDAERAFDFNSMFEDDSVDAVWCLRGGWGSARILDSIDFDLIKANPKAVIGYSDITSLLNAIYVQTGLVTFHGPLAVYGESQYTEELFLDLLLDQKTDAFENHPEANIVTINPGTASGRLLGGNLTVLTHILGSPYAPDFNGSILFLEDVSEPAYSVDRMLTHLKLAGVLDRIRGFIFGTCARCTGDERAFTVEQIIENHIKPLGIPAYTGASIGHMLHKMTVPVGVNVSMDASRGIFKVNESAFSLS